jgi:hypothetical protein
LIHGQSVLAARFAIAPSSLGEHSVWIGKSRRPAVVVGLSCHLSQ